ncbi:MAG: YraN family protein [Gaiellaceae bacterium]
MRDPPPLAPRARLPHGGAGRAARGRRLSGANGSERRAAWWYRLHGYRVLDTDRRLGAGEIDIVARRGSALVFCEVKARSVTSFEDPLEAVTERKARRVRSAAAVWILRHPEARGLEVRFDVIADRGGRLEHVPNAF